LRIGPNTFYRDEYTPTIPNHVEDLVFGMCYYAPGTCSVVDCFYGGIQVIEKLAKNHVYCVAKCTAIRPAWLFKNYLHPLLKTHTKFEVVLSFFHTSFPHFLP